MTSAWPEAAAVSVLAESALESGVDSAVSAALSDEVEFCGSSYSGSFSAYSSSIVGILLRVDEASSASLGALSPRMRICTPEARLTVNGSEPSFFACSFCSSSSDCQLPHSEPLLTRTWIRMFDFDCEKVKPMRLGLFVGTSRTSEISAMLTPSSVLLTH